VKISIIICTYTLERLNDLFELLESVKRQSYKDFDILIVVDGNRELYDLLSSRLNSWHADNIKVILNEVNKGLSYSRNRGINSASGDVIAFIDDDATADEHWLQNLASVYKDFDAVGVGGKVLPLWLNGASDYFPEELYWIVGATHSSFLETEKLSHVRNLFGGNMSFKRGIFKKVGLFNQDFGRKANFQIQAEETEFCMRLTTKLGKEVIYNPKAIVYHKVFPARTKMRFLIRRAFWQGYSKSLLSSMYKSDALSAESAYLRRAMVRIYGGSLRKFFKDPSKTLKQLFMFSIVLAAVAGGYLYFFLPIGRRS